MAGGALLSERPWRPRSERILPTAEGWISPNFSSVAEGPGRFRRAAPPWPGDAFHSKSGPRAADPSGRSNRPRQLLSGHKYKQIEQAEGHSALSPPEGRSSRLRAMGADGNLSRGRRETAGPSPRHPGRDRRNRVLRAPLRRWELVHHADDALSSTVGFLPTRRQASRRREELTAVWDQVGFPIGSST